MSTLPSAAVCGKPRLLSADLDGSPLPCATWQADLENQLPYFTHALRWRFRRYPPDKRAERVQEAIVQITILMARQYKQYGGRIDYRKELVRRVVYWAKVGRSSTRERGHNADPLDRSRLRTKGLARKSGHLLPVLTLARPDLPTGTRIDVKEWIGKMPPRLREYATLAYEGTPDEEIRRIMGISKQRIQAIRARIRRLWKVDLA